MLYYGRSNQTTSNLDIIVSEYTNSIYLEDKTTSELIEWIRTNNETYSMNNFKVSSIPIVLYTNNFIQEDIGGLSISKHVLKPQNENDKTLCKEIKSIVKNWRQEIFDDLEIMGIGIDYDFSKIKCQSHSGYAVRAKSKKTKILSSKIFFTQQALPYLWVKKDFFETEKTIDQLEYLVNDYLKCSSEELKRKDWEEQFQLFFQTNPKFLFGNSYSKFWSKPTLKDEFANKIYYPDFVKQPKVDYDLGKNWEVIDLKTPITDFVQTSDFHKTFTAKFHKYLTQLRDYQTYFKDERNKKAIETKFNFHIKYPKFALIVGKKDAYYRNQDVIEKRMNEENYSFINLITYDEIIENQKLELERLFELRVF